jgi:hypothetical protein
MIVLSSNYKKERRKKRKEKKRKGVFNIMTAWFSFGL